MGYSQEINKDNCIQVNNNLTPPSINRSTPNETHNERIECVNNADVSSGENPQDRSDEGVDDLSGLNQQDYSKSGIEASETVSDDSPNSTCVSRSKKTFVTSHKLKRSLEEQPMIEESQNKLMCYVFSPFQKRGESVQNADIFSEELPHYSTVFVVDTSVCIGDNTAVIADDDTSFNSVRDTSIYIADNTEVISDDDTAVNSVVDTSGSIQQGYVTYTNAIGSIDSPCADFSPPCPSLSGSTENLLVNTPPNDKQDIQSICALIYISLTNKLKGKTSSFPQTFRRSLLKYELRQNE
ncbi:hypothetical protein Btru_034218 [Bulinus truncatus]|nr:hypothetical protein Btru_034218 [Bulinus truncatus]